MDIQPENRKVNTEIPNLTFTYPKRTQLPPKAKQLVFLIERVLNSFGYQPLHPRTAAKVVPGIETECLDKIF
jgi:hypothetical protein